jgi:hypothetical protein
MCVKRELAMRRSSVSRFLHALVLLHEQAVRPALPH